MSPSFLFHFPFIARRLHLSCLCHQAISSSPSPLARASASSIFSLASIQAREQASLASMVESTTSLVKLEQDGSLFLPPGFRFHPTDAEVILSYLLQKLLNPSFTSLPIGEVDLNKCEPWDLPSKSNLFFFSSSIQKLIFRCTSS